MWGKIEYIVYISLGDQFLQMKPDCLFICSSVIRNKLIEVGIIHIPCDI